MYAVPFSCLVAQCQAWRWSSAAPLVGGEPILDPGPVPRPENWLDHVNEPQTEAEVERLRECVRRRRPYGDALWMAKAAHRLGLQASLRPLGRPKKQVDDNQ